jgi:hypothetical protein
MIVGRVTATATLAAAVCLMLGGCVPTARPAPTAEQFFGTWVHGDTVLVLKEDQTFTLTDAPLYTGVLQEPWTDGTTITRDKQGSWALELDAVRLGNEKLFFDYESSEIVLSWGLELGSDDPRCFELARENSTRTPRGPEQCFLRG